MFISFLPGVRTSSRRRVGARTALVAFVTALALSTVRASATEGNWCQDSNGRTADTPVGVVNTDSPREFRVVASRGTDDRAWTITLTNDVVTYFPGILPSGGMGRSKTLRRLFSNESRGATHMLINQRGTNLIFSKLVQ